jgi:alanyl-tRNA synthetase
MVPREVRRLIVEKYGLNELRKMFLDFFRSKGHLVHESYSLVPHNDKSVLLIPAGMAPLKPYFTGQEIPPCTRMATCQKCIRTGDIENVGKTARHGTFFEMLGNFSFGDYFKKEALEWSWEFLTDVVGMDKDRLYPSVYLDDDEAFEIWNKDIGVPAERIFRFGKEDNFWEHGAGPCGPCSEIYYDRGEQYGCGKPGCTVGCDCDRYMEVWNDVFTQFENDGNGNYTELTQKNIDTGMGLERLAMAVQDVDSIFNVDTIRALLDEVASMAGVKYNDNHKTDISLRLITDHIRSVTFMVSDGILPSNEGRGYVLRRLLRRAARHGRMLGIEGAFLTKLSAKVIEVSRSGYPDLAEKQNYIHKVISQEEENFNRTINQGLEFLGDYMKKLEESGQKQLAGEDAFKLYDTYGFPLDLTKEILEEKGFTVDEEGFAASMEEQRVRARKARGTSNYMGAEDSIYQSMADITTAFTGYDTLESGSTIAVLGLKKEENGEDGVKHSFDVEAEALTDGDEGTIVTLATPFYATKGGQVGDTGIITGSEGAIFQVESTIPLPGGKTGHVGRVLSGMFRRDEEVELKVDEARRRLICRNHSATHLLQKALREVLGDHVTQNGSYVDADRLRFDFTHFSAMTPEEIKKVEKIVNSEIQAALKVSTEEMGIDEARKTGAMALFGEKYGDKVRVVSMGDFSVELCGGTHVANTEEINCFKIISESGVAAGVRRIEALTSAGLLAYYDDADRKLHEAAAAAKTSADSLTDRIRQLNDEIKKLQHENAALSDKLAKASMGDLTDKIKDVCGMKLLAAEVPEMDMNGLRSLSDELKAKVGEGVVVLATKQAGKVNLIVSATDAALKAGAHAGNLIRAIAPKVGGGGGGRPNMAQAGGKNPEGIADAIAEAEKVLTGMLSK